MKTIILMLNFQLKIYTCNLFLLCILGNCGLNSVYLTKWLHLCYRCLIRMQQIIKNIKKSHFLSLIIYENSSGWKDLIITNYVLKIMFHNRTFLDPGLSLFNINIFWHMWTISFYVWILIQVDQYNLQKKKKSDIWYYCFYKIY